MYKSVGGRFQVCFVFSVVWPWWSQWETARRKKGPRTGVWRKVNRRPHSCDASTSFTFLKNWRNVSHKQPCQFYSTLSWRGEAINRPLKALTHPKFNFNQPRKPRADTTATPPPAATDKTTRWCQRNSSGRAACETLLCQILADRLPPSSNCGIKNK